MSSLAFVRDLEGGQVCILGHNQAVERGNNAELACKLFPPHEPGRGLVGVKQECGQDEVDVGRFAYLLRSGWWVVAGVSGA